LADLRAAAVHQHHLDAHLCQQHDVGHDRLLEARVDHGVAAVLDHDDLAGVLLDVGQRGGEYIRAQFFGDGVHRLTLLRFCSRR